MSSSTSYLAELLRKNADIEEKSANIAQEAEMIVHKEEEVPDFKFDIEDALASLVFEPEIEDVPSLEPEIEDVPSLASIPTQGLDSSTTNRVNAAKISALSTQVEKLKTELSQKDHNTMAKKYNDMKDELTILRRNNQQLETQLERAKKQLLVEEKRRAPLENEISLLKKDYKTQSTDKQKLEHEFKTTSVKLSRALQESEKAKSLLKKRNESSAPNNSAMTQENQRLAAENKTLMRQKTELINAFKKQLKLIDVLKRQKIHLEAAQALHFTEEEFNKTLELGNNFK